MTANVGVHTSSYLSYSPLTMDTLPFHAPPSASPSMANKRPCPSSPSQNPRLDQLDRFLDTFLSLSDSSPHSIDLSFDRLLDSRSSDADQSLLIDRALRFGSSIIEAAKRSSRKRASKHNSVAWALPSDLTIKVRRFS